MANSGGQGTISVLQTAKAPVTPASPGTTTSTATVNLPAGTVVNNLVVTIAVGDLAGVQNISVTLVAPNGLGSVTLVENQDGLLGMPVITSRGLTGGNSLGIFGYTTMNPGTVLGTTFDDHATRDIFDPTTTGMNGADTSGGSYVGHFRPEVGTLNSLIAAAGGNASLLNGPWQLIVTNFSINAPTGSISEFHLQFTTRMTATAPNTVAGKFDVISPVSDFKVPLLGAIGDIYTSNPQGGIAPTPNTGVGPGLVMAEDNTLGPDSPYKNRIYLAFTAYHEAEFPAFNGTTNPPRNTDIYLVYSDNGGASWSIPVEVNNDASQSDGYSQSNDTANPDPVTGRTQFQPELAVDQATGTLVASWRDAHNDASDARVATYIATSIDGGNTFSAQVYANPNSVAIDSITGKQDIISPQADNQSSGNGQRDGTFGYGNQMGLTVFDGQLYPIWAGNLNQSYLNNGVVTGRPLNIFYQPMVIAAGPRIIDSSQGPITLPAGNTDLGIAVTFDRPVNPNTFTPADVQVYYHDTAFGTAYIGLTVDKVVPVAGSGNNQFGFTQFTIDFNPTPPGQNPATYNYTGTYSYVIAPSPITGSGPPISADLVVHL